MQITSTLFKSKGFQCSILLQSLVRIGGPEPGVGRTPGRLRAEYNDVGSQDGYSEYPVESVYLLLGLWNVDNV